jgi:CRP/FNR family cyclic AMP-dependent transcriptional regulator
VERLLASMPFFSDLTADDRATLAETLQQRTSARGDIIFREGERGDTVYLVVEGKVKITTGGSGNRENLLAILGPGDVFGELTLFDPSPRTATATALTELRYASLSHDQLRAWLQTRPDVAGMLLAVLARRLRRTNQSMADLVFTDVPGRVAKALLELSERFGAPAGVGIRVEHGLTQEELAQLVGASRETVNKALADFATRGWLRLESRAVVLLDRDRLARRAR